MSSPSSTGCTCRIAGFCPRHQIDKHEHWFHLCQTRQNYFQAWEEGRGPGQIMPSGYSPPPKADEDLPELSIEEQLRRQAICEACCEYVTGQRCKLIEYGCRTAYQKKVRLGECPHKLF